MATRVKDMMLSLEEYAVVAEDATILDALVALDDSQVKVPPGRQPHRAVLVRGANGAIVGKLHHFAFMRALIPERDPMLEKNVLDQAGVSDDLLQASMQTLDFLTGDLVNVCERARNVRVRDVCTPANAGIDEAAPLSDAIAAFLKHQTLSLLVRRGQEAVGILRLSDLFDALANEIRREDCL